MKTTLLLGALLLGATGIAAQQAPAAPAAKPNASLPSHMIEELTWTEVRDAVAAGVTVAIVPTGGTEKNGYHMIMGKHNRHSVAGAHVMAEELGNALIAPVLKYVPEGQATENNPGVLSCRDACFENQLFAAARSLRVHGFKHILFIGDNGGNQGGLTSAATKLNAEFAGSDVKVFALTDFYEKGHEYLDAYFAATYGWNAQQVGSHAGIKDTSQMMYVNPAGVRPNRFADSEANRQESGTTGDPTKATAEFGRLGIRFKAWGALQQYAQLIAPPRQGR